MDPSARLHNIVIGTASDAASQSQRSFASWLTKHYDNTDLNTALLLGADLIVSKAKRSTSRARNSSPWVWRMMSYAPRLPA